MGGGWAPNPMAIGATQVDLRSPVSLGQVARLPCATVEPARPTHVSAGANKRTPVVGWGHSPRLRGWAGASQLTGLLTEIRPTAATPSALQGRYWHSSGATPMSAVTLGLEPAVRRWTRGPSWQAAQGWVLRPLCAGDSREKRRSPSTTDECFRSSKPASWAWLDLNQRPHPYQLNTGNRCADRRSQGHARLYGPRYAFNQPTGMRCSNGPWDSLTPRSSLPSRLLVTCSSYVASYAHTCRARMMPGGYGA